MNRYALRTGEPLAISANAILRDADGFYLVMGGDPPENEARGSVVIVNIRGALQQFEGPGGDSYEAIYNRVERASKDKPSAVVLRISSPGGVVAGLNECVRKLRRLSRATGIPYIAFADELAASAAYAMCCACSEILLPPSGIVGSIGVISTMISVAKHDQQEGIEFRIITSGTRKADGHLHMPISDAAVRAETDRNDEMARQFFALASKARGVPPTQLRSLQAAIYMGKRAVNVGLADDVIGLDDALYGLDTSSVSAGVPPAPNEGNVTDRRAKDAAAKKVLDVAHSAATHTDTRSGGTTATAGEVPMAVKLAALIKTTEAAISTEADPKKLRALRADLASFYVAKAAMDGDDDDDDDDKKDKDDDDEEDESKASKMAEAARKAKAKAESAKHRAKAAEHKSKAAEYEEAAKKCEEEASGGEEEERTEEATDLLDGASALTPGQAAALASQGALAREALDRIAKLEADATARAQTSLIDGALAKRRITRPEAKTLRAKPMAFVKDFLEMRPKSLINVDEADLFVPDVDAKGNAILPADVARSVDEAMAVAGEGKTPEQRAALRQGMVEAHQKRMNGTTNGIGRY